MIIVKGDLGVAINPIRLKIIKRQPQTIYVSNEDINGSYEDIENNYGYCIEAVFENSDVAILTEKINSFNEAKERLDELYKDIFFVQA